MGLADILAGMERKVEGPEVPPASLKETIEKRFKSERKSPPLTPLKTNGVFLRASGFAVVCPREEVLAAIHNIMREEKFNADPMVNFALGTGMHRALQDEILPAAGVMRGEWKCLGCAKHFGGMSEPNRFRPEEMIFRPEKCSECGETEFAYVEQYFRSLEWGLTGHPDGYIELPGRGLGVVEAKSISGRGAYEIKKVPKFDHVIQAQIYMWFTGLPWACVLYWDKATFGVNGFVEHFIERDDATIEQIKTALKSIWSGIEGGPLPDRICADNKCARAKNCALVTQCFEADAKKYDNLLGE